MLLAKSFIIAQLLLASWSPFAAQITADRCPVYKILNLSASGLYWPLPRCKIEVQNPHPFFLSHEALHEWLDFKGLWEAEIERDVRRVAAEGYIPARDAAETWSQKIHWIHAIEINSNGRIFEMPTWFRKRYFDWHSKQYRLYVPVAGRAT